MKKAVLLTIILGFILIELMAFAIAETNSEDDPSVATLYNSNNLACTADAKLCDDGSYVSRNSSKGCKFDECPESEDDDKPILGASCGTVTPGYQNECCKRKGYDSWDVEKFECINETEEENEDNDSEEEIVKENYTISKERVCCKIYGYGTNMEEADVKYIITTKKECSVPKNFVGGSREIVNNSYCIEQIKERRQEVRSNIKKIIQAKNRIRAYYSNSSECPEKCTCSGSTLKCEFENGSKVMTVYAGDSGNVIVQVKNINASTKVTLYKGDEGEIYGVFKNNETKAIILPDEALEKLKERHQKRLQLSNESINLTEEGYYQIEGKKKARLFWIVPVKERMRAEINAETGETIKIRNPWWGFLARDVREDTDESI